MPAGRVELTEGADALRCLRLSEKVLRWYAECCRTPVANTARGPRFPIVAVIHSFMDHESGGRSRDEVLGAPFCRIYERSATGPLPTNAPPRPSFRRILARRGALVLGTWLRGLGRPSAFFDARTGAPRAEPHGLPS